MLKLSSELVKNSSQQQFSATLGVHNRQQQSYDKVFLLHYPTRHPARKELLLITAGESLSSPT